jgi:hypothetical protein
MPPALIWTGQEILHLSRFRNILRAASRLVGHDDVLANLLLEDALEELQTVLGERAASMARPSGLCGHRDVGGPVLGAALRKRRGERSSGP